MKERLTLAQIVIRYTLCTINLLFFSTVGVSTAQASTLLESGEDYPASTVGVPIAQASVILTSVGEHFAAKGAELILGSLGFGDSEKDAVKEGVESIDQADNQLEKQFQQLDTQMKNNFSDLGTLVEKGFYTEAVNTLYTVLLSVKSNTTTLYSATETNGDSATETNGDSATETNSVSLINELNSYVEDANKGSGPFKNTNSIPADRQAALKSYDPDFVSSIQTVISDEIIGHDYFNEIGSYLDQLRPYSLKKGKFIKSSDINVAVQSMQSLLNENISSIQKGSTPYTDVIYEIAQYDKELIYQAGYVLEAVQMLYDTEVFLLQLQYMGFMGVPSPSSLILDAETPEDYFRSFAKLQLQEGLLKEVLAVFYQGYFYTDYVQKPDDYILQKLDDETLQKLDDETLQKLDDYILQKLDDDAPQKLDDETLQKLDDYILQKLYDDNLLYIQVRDLNILPGGAFRHPVHISVKASSALKALSHASKHFQGNLASLDPLNVDSVLKKIKNRASLILAFNQVQNLLSSQDKKPSSSQDKKPSSNKIITLSTQREIAGPFAWNERCMIFQYYSPELSNPQGTNSAGSSSSSPKAVPLIGSYDGTELTAFCKTLEQTQAEQTQAEQIKPTKSTLSLTTCQDPSTDVPIVPNNIIVSNYDPIRPEFFPLGTMFCQLETNDGSAMVLGGYGDASKNYFKIDNNSGDEYDIYLEGTDVQYVQLLDTQDNLYQVSPTQWQNGSAKPDFTAYVQVLTKDGDMTIFAIGNDLAGVGPGYLSLFCNNAMYMKNSVLESYSPPCSSGSAGEMGQFAELTLFGNCTVRLDGGGYPIGHQKGYLHICEGGQK